MGEAAMDGMEECPDPEQEPEDEDDTDIHLEAVILAGWTELEPRFKLKMELTMLLSWFSCHSFESVSRHHRYVWRVVARPMPAR